MIEDLSRNSVNISDRHRRPRRWIQLIRDISLLTIALRFWPFKTKDNVCDSTCGPPVVGHQKNLNSRKGQRTNQKYRNLVGSDQQMQRLA